MDTQTSARDEIIELVELFFDCLVSGDLDRLPVASSFTVQSPLTPPLSGEDAIDYVKAVSTAARRITVLEHIVEDNRVATLLDEEVGEVTLRVFSKFRVDNGQISDVRVFYDPRVLEAATRSPR
jgi:ketosteroid isomerase-like protein